MTTFVGLDFGTSNGALAILSPDGTTRLASFATASGAAEVFPSVLYMTAGPPPARARRSFAGHQATARYLAADDHRSGRFLQSLKSYLADRRFTDTAVLGKRYALEDLVALIIRHLVHDAGLTHGADVAVVVGRPVRFAGADDEAEDERSERRLQECLRRAGIEHVTFEFEPVAAAYAYEQRLTRDELILIGDFGGGTSDFTIVRVGPGARREGRGRILGTAGIGIAGDAFDRVLVRHVVAPRLGMGSDYLSPPDRVLPIPVWPYEKLERWHYLSFLRTPDTIAMLERLRRAAQQPAAIGALLSLIQNDLGLPLHQSVQRAKFALSVRHETAFRFEAADVSMRVRITRAEFEGWASEEAARLGATIDHLMAASGVAPSAVDRVFLTGGTSFVPMVRRLFVERFGAGKITGGGELTAVATGLALRAREMS